MVKMKSYVDSSWGRVIPIVDPPMSWMLGIILIHSAFIYPKATKFERRALNKEKYISYDAREMIKYISSLLGWERLKLVF